MEAAETSFQVKIDAELCSASENYRVMDLLGEGTFASVAKCSNLEAGNTVAIKIFKNCDDDTVDYEVEVLEALLDVDPDEKNIIKFMGSFTFQDLPCLIFEMLDKSLWDLMLERHWAPLSLGEIRPITQQLLVAFDALKDLGIMYTDLKLDNIMLVNHSEWPFKVKLIDFGLAVPQSQVEGGEVMQVLAYRAPEVTLGLPLTTAIDMWSVACLMAHVYAASFLLPFNCEYKWMKAMLHLVGQPDTRLLAAGKYTWRFFTQDLENHGFRFNSPEEYNRHTGRDPSVLKMIGENLEKTLDQVVLTSPDPPGAAEEDDDRIAFLSFLKCCLTVDAHERITPGEALNHSFITMDHLRGDRETASYVNAAAQLMSVCHQCDLGRSADEPLNNETAEPKDNSRAESRHDSRTNRPSAQESKRPQSCHPAEASDAHSDEDSDTQSSSQCYAFNDEEQSSFQSVLSQRIDNDNPQPESIDSGGDISAPPSAATRLCGGKESSTTATVTNGRAVGVRKSSAGPRWKPLRRRVRCFFRRVRKGLVQFFMCGANNTD